MGLISLRFYSVNLFLVYVKKIIAKKLDIEQFADILTKEYKRIGIEVKN